MVLYVGKYWKYDGHFSSNTDESFQFQIVWVSLWVSKLVAKALPYVFQTLMGVVSGGVKKYATVIRALEIPLSLVGWAIASMVSFEPVSIAIF